MHLRARTASLRRAEATLRRCVSCPGAWSRCWLLASSWFQSDPPWITWKLRRPPGQLRPSRDDAPQENHRQEAREHCESSPVSFARTPDGSGAPQGEHDRRSQTRSKNERSNSGPQRIAPRRELRAVVSSTAELVASSGSLIEAETNVPASGLRTGCSAGAASGATLTSISFFVDCRRPLAPL